MAVTLFQKNKLLAWLSRTAARIGGGLCFLGLALLLAGGEMVRAQEPLTALENMQRGDAAFQRKNYQVALDFYRRSIEKNRNFIQAYSRMARTLQILGEFNQARFYYIKSIELEGENAEAFAGLSQISLEMGEMEKARQYLETATRLAPGSIEINYSRGEYFRRQGKHELAQLHFKKVIQRNPAHIRALLGMARVKAFRGEYSQADRHLEKALLVDPVYPEIYYVKGELYLKQLFEVSDRHQKSELIEKANTAFVTANQLAPDDYRIEKNITLLELFKNRVDLALKRSSNLTKKFPEKHDLRLLQAYLIQKNRGTRSIDAVSNLKKAISLEPYDSLARFSLEQLSVKILRRRSSGGLLRKELADFNFKQALKYRTNNQLDRSEFFMRRTLFLDGEHKKALVERLEYFRLNNDYERFLNVLTKLRNRQPENIKLQFRLEKALNQKKSYLAYRENLLSQAAYGNRATFKRTPTLVGVFDFAPLDLYPLHPDGSELVATALRINLEERGRLSTTSNNFQNQLRAEVERVSDNSKDFRFGDFYNPGYLALISEIEQRLDTEVELMVGGYYRSTPTGLLVQYEVYRKKTGELLDSFEISATGSTALQEVSLLAAERIYNSVIYSGRVITNRNGKVYLNLGTIDGVKTGDEFFTYRAQRVSSELNSYNQKELIKLLTEKGAGFTCKIVEVARYISRCEPALEHIEKIERGDIALKLEAPPEAASNENVTE